MYEIIESKKKRKIRNVKYHCCQLKSIKNLANRKHGVKRIVTNHRLILHICIRNR